MTRAGGSAIWVVIVGCLALVAGASAATIVGTPHADVLRGSAAADRLDGRAGADQLSGLSGDDQLLGGSGVDQLYGGIGNDRLSGGSGVDTLAGGSGVDRLSGEAGNDLLSGGPGNDELLGGPGKDSLAGGAGNDRLDGGAGNDTLDGGPGVDQVSCGPGKDTVAADARDQVARDCETILAPVKAPVQPAPVPKPPASQDPSVVELAACVDDQDAGEGRCRTSVEGQKLQRLQVVHCTTIVANANGRSVGLSLFRDGVLLAEKSAESGSDAMFSQALSYSPPGFFAPAGSWTCRVAIAGQTAKEVMFATALPAPG